MSGWNKNQLPLLLHKRENRQRSNDTVGKIKCDAVIMAALKSGRDVKAVTRGDAAILK